MKQILFATIFMASAAHAEVLPSWRSALQSGSRHLALHSLLDDRPKGGETLSGQLAKGLGFAHRGPIPSYLGGTYFVRPTIDFDRNINGGIPGETISVGPYRFRIDDESRAASGYLAGVAAGGELSWSYARASTVSASFYSSLAHAVEENLSVAITTAAVCGKHLVYDWTWIDLCLRGVKAQRDLSDVSERIATVGVTRVFSSALGSHELSLDVSKATRTDYDKLSAEISLLSAVSGLGALKLATEFGEKVPEETTRLRGASMSLTRPVSGKPTTFALATSESAGGSLFGIGREDRTNRVSVSRRINRWMVATAQWTETNSSISAYEDTYATLSVQFIGWSGRGN